MLAKTPVTLELRFRKPLIRGRVMGESAVLKPVIQDVQRFARQIRKILPLDRARQRRLDV